MKTALVFGSSGLVGGHLLNQLIKDNNLHGLESNQKFYHLNTLNMYKKILSLNIID